jgi:hypothetical protein
MNCGEARLKSGVKKIGQQLPVTSVFSVSSVREFSYQCLSIRAQRRLLFDLWRR